MGGCGIGRFDLRSPVISSQWMDVRTSLCVPLPVRQRDAQSLAAAVFCESSRHRIADARGTVINSGAARQLGASLKGGNLLSPSASVRPHLRLHHGCIGDRQRHDIIAIILMPSLRVGRRRLRCASTGGRGFSCGVVRAQGSSLLSSTPYYHLVPVLPEKVTSPRIGLLCLREHPRAAGWGCGWS